MSSPEPEILFDRRGAAGLVTLNRPKALNAVTLQYARELRAAGITVNAVDPIAATLLRLAGAGIIRSAHDISDGGLVVTVAESCFAGVRAYSGTPGCRFLVEASFFWGGSYTGWI